MSTALLSRSVSAFLTKGDKHAEESILILQRFIAYECRAQQMIGYGFNLMIMRFTKRYVSVDV